MSAIKNFSREVYGTVAKFHNKIVANRLNDFGLKLQDLYTTDVPGVQQAISRLPYHEQEARIRRQFRASDISGKRKYLPKEHQLEDTHDLYLEPHLQEVWAEIEERKILDGGL